MKKTISLSIALMFVITISNAQTIPNSGFENWTTMTGYSNPDMWGTMNNTTTLVSVYTAEMGTPGNSSASYLKLTSKTTPLGVANGIAVSGKLDSLTMQPISGFAFSQRPANLTGSWQHMIYGSSQGSIKVTLTRWDNGLNQRVSVAIANQTLSGMAMSWTNFTIPFTYTDGGNPDTCIIVLKASGTAPTNLDYLYVDNLAFSGSVTGISENHFEANISVFPNPASENLILDLSALQDKNVSVQIFDVTGKQVQLINSVSVASKTTLDISTLPKGNYVLNIVAKEGTLQRNFIKQ